MHTAHYSGNPLKGVPWGVQGLVLRFWESLDAIRWHGAESRWSVSLYLDQVSGVSGDCHTPTRHTTRHHHLVGKVRASCSHVMAAMATPPKIQPWYPYLGGEAGTRGERLSQAVQIPPVCERGPLRHVNSCGYATEVMTGIFTAVTKRMRTTEVPLFSIYKLHINISYII